MIYSWHMIGFRIGMAFKTHAEYPYFFFYPVQIHQLNDVARVCDAYGAFYYWNLRMKKWAYVSSINCGYND